MNNKILARLVAAVMAIAMLGTVSFAATISSVKVDTTTDTVLNVANDTDAAYADNTGVKTLMAFAADTANAEPAAADIIALVQNDDATAPASIKIDAAKLVGKHYVIVRFGGNGSVAKRVICLDGTAVTPKDTITVDGAEFTDVAYFTANIDTEGTVKNYGFKIANKKATGTYNYIMSDDVKEIQGTGFSYGFLVVGVEGADWDATAFYTAE